MNDHMPKEEIATVYLLRWESSENVEPPLEDHQKAFPFYDISSDCGKCSRYGRCMQHCSHERDCNLNWGT
jgi:hypothetical protein